MRQVIFFFYSPQRNGGAEFLPSLHWKYKHTWLKIKWIIAYQYVLGDMGCPVCFCKLTVLYLSALTSDSYIMNIKCMHYCSKLLLSVDIIMLLSLYLPFFHKFEYL